MAAKPLIKRYAELAAEKAELDAKLNAVKKKIAAIEHQVLDFMVKHEIENQRVNGRTVYIERKLWATKAEGVEPANFVHLLQDNGFEEFATYSPQRLTAFVRELDDNGEAVPEWLAGAIKVDERFSLRSRKA